MSEWTKVKIKEVYRGLYDGPHATPPTSESGGVYLGISNIYPNGHIDLSDVKYISKDDLPKWTKRVVPQEGDIVFSYEATLNLYAIIPRGFYGCLGRRMALIRINDEIASNQFIFYYFFSNEWRATIAENTIIGATVDRIPIAKFPDFPIYLPPLNVQHHIATTLSRYDSLIENYQKQIKLLEEAAQRLYKEWFVDLHFPGHEHTKIIDGVPEGWEKKTISDVCTNISSGSTPSRNNKSYWENGTIKWVKTKELLDGWIIDTEEYITQDGYNNSSTKLFPENTILMAIYASPTLGRLGILSTECCCNQAALGLVADEKVVSWQWLFWKLFELRDEFNLIARGAGQQNISGIVVKKKEIIVPDKRTINLFTYIASSMFEQQKTLQSQIHLLTEARDRLLPKLMSGEIKA